MGTKGQLSNEPVSVLGFASQCVPIVITFTIVTFVMGSQYTLGRTRQGLRRSSVGEKTCPKMDSLNNWANNLPILKTQDLNIIKLMKDLVQEQTINTSLSDDTVIDHFQHIMALPLQTFCSVGKWIALDR